VVAAGVLLLVAVTLALPFRPRTGEGRAVDVDVPSGASDADVIARHEAAGVVSGPVFGLYARVRGGILARSGRHLLRDDLSPVEVLRRLRRSPDATHIRVTFPEGWTRFEIAARLEKQRICDAASFLAAVADPKLGEELGVPGSLEGWLFPSTYELPADGDARDGGSLALPPRLEPRLQQEGGSRAVDHRALAPGIGAALRQRGAGLHRREALVPEDHLAAARVGEGLRERLGAARGAPRLPAKRERQAHDEAIDTLALGQGDERGDEAVAVLRDQRWPRMGEQRQLVVDRDAAPSAAEVETHRASHGAAGSVPRRGTRAGPVARPRRVR